MFTKGEMCAHAGRESPKSLNGYVQGAHNGKVLVVEVDSSSKYNIDV